MDEKTALKLLNYLQSHPNNFEIIQPKLEQCYQAITWADSLQKWDLVIAFSSILAYHFEFSHPMAVYFEDQGRNEPSERMRYFWEQAKMFSEQGLMAATRVENLEKRMEFLVVLSRLSRRLNDLEVALDYLKQELNLVNPNTKWRTVREINLLGREASNQGHFLLARTCYQTCLTVYEKMDNKSSIAELLTWMAANEQTRIEKVVETGKQFNDSPQDVVDALWKLSDAFREEAKASQEKSTIYDRLQETLVKLSSLT
jgi:tetratricopeptide (TPR) repeat protein